MGMKQKLCMFRLLRSMKLWLAYEMSSTGACVEWIISTQLVQFWKIVEAVGSGAQLEEVGPRVHAFEGYTWFLFPYSLFAFYLLQGEQLPPSHTPTTMRFCPSAWADRALNLLKPWTWTNYSSPKLLHQVFWYQRSRAVAMTLPDDVVQKPLELVYRRNLEKFDEVG
jgi:hypothetical protein